jgi:FKBP-type peptidyl-prolyl cis-trans isomerase
MYSRLIRLVAAALLVTACGGNTPNAPTEVTGTAAYSATDLRVGTGAEAMTGRQAVVNYTGWLYSNTATDNKGRQFDSSIGRAPFPFTPGVTNVIQGWHQGVPGMRVGGLRRLVLPPNLAYGAAGRPPDIPQNATLLFEIELLSVQ